jgi:hypothetical protein
MVWKGTVQGNKIVVENGACLPGGAQVEIRLLALPPAPPSDHRQEALARLLSRQLPVADWEQMEEEIIRGAVE